MIAAIYALAQGRPDHALVWALLAIAWAVMRLKPGMLGRMWHESVDREQRKLDGLLDDPDDGVLFRGRRDDG